MDRVDHFWQPKELGAELNRIKLHDHGGMTVVALATELVGGPMMGQISAEQHQVAVAVVADMVSHESGS
jgi:hypothetical protein